MPYSWDEDLEDRAERSAQFLTGDGYSRLERNELESAKRSLKCRVEGAELQTLTALLENKQIPPNPVHHFLSRNYESYDPPLIRCLASLSDERIDQEYPPIVEIETRLSPIISTSDLVQRTQLAVLELIKIYEKKEKYSSRASSAKRILIDTTDPYRSHPGREELWEICTGRQHPELQDVAKDILGYHRLPFWTREHPIKAAITSIILAGTVSGLGYMLSQYINQ